MSMNLQELEQLIRDPDACFFYCGPMIQDVIEGMAQALLQILKSGHTDMKAAQSVFSVFIEATQNVMKYSGAVEAVSETEEIRYGAVCVSRKSDGFCIRCGNPVTLKDAELLRTQLDRLLPMTKEELRVLYKQKIYDQSNTNQRGAGLGLIEIAKLAQQPMEYALVPRDDAFVYYTLNVMVGGTKHV